jgi:molybdopterin synthase sulfur carrier subunit
MLFRDLIEDKMIIQVRAFANFRDILGRDLRVELREGSSIKELLDSLCNSHQRLKSAVFDDSGKVREYIILMKNRKDVDSLEGLKTTLSEGDEVAILPPVAGG